MKPQNELALITAYYLSRLDDKAYLSLGYKNFTEATRGIGAILRVKPRTIQGMRDEFDPFHQNSRVGWVRELKGSRLKIMKSFQDTDDETLSEIVKEILFGKEFNKSEEYQDIHVLFGESKTRGRQQSSVYIVRGPTGKAAEIFFIGYFEKNGSPVKGKLIDCRDLGCGYDFKVQDGDKYYFVEVKGLTKEDGGVLFTNKEWQMAQKYKDKYYLALVKNLFTAPVITLIQDPCSKLKPTKNIYTTLQVSWSVGAKALSIL